MPNRERIERSIEIDAPPATVWSVVADLRRMGEWSPQCRRMIVLGRRVRVGTRTINLNAHGWKRWVTTSRVTRFEPERALAFRVDQNRTVWTFELEPASDGVSRVTERRTIPQGVSGVSNLLTERVLGGTDRFEAGLDEGMERTLQRLRSEVEAG